MLLLGIICDSYKDVLLEHKKVECFCAKMLLLNNQSIVQDYDGSPSYLDFFYRAMNYHTSIVKLQVILGRNVFPNNYYRSLTVYPHYLS